MKIRQCEEVVLWLIDNHLYRKISDNIREQQFPRPFTVKDIYRILPFDEKINLLSSSFQFDKTKEGEDFWFDKNREFKLWYKGNIESLEKLRKLYVMRDSLKYVFENSTNEFVRLENQDEYYKILEEIEKLEV